MRAQGSDDPAASPRTVLKYAAGVGLCLLFGWFAFVREASDPLGNRVPLLGGVDLGFHELGHMLTYAFPDLMTSMMGSITQVAVPLGLAIYFAWRRKDLLGTGICLAWAGTSAQDVSEYIADAPYEYLPLIGGQHDWAYILGPEQFNMLDSADTVAGTVKTLGLLLLIAGTLTCAAGPFVEQRRRKAELKKMSMPPPGSGGGWAVIPPWEQEGGQA